MTWKSQEGAQRLPDNNSSITPRSLEQAREKKILEEFVNILEVRVLVGSEGIVNILRNANKVSRNLPSNQKQEH
jgi:hypothetical protein